MTRFNSALHTLWGERTSPPHVAIFATCAKTPPTAANTTCGATFLSTLFCPVSRPVRNEKVSRGYSSDASAAAAL